MLMYVYVGSSKTPIVIETNLAWALPYWTLRKFINPAIHWKIQ